MIAIFVYKICWCYFKNESYLLLNVKIIYRKYLMSWIIISLHLLTYISKYIASSAQIPILIFSKWYLYPHWDNQCLFLALWKFWLLIVILALCMFSWASDTILEMLPHCLHIRYFAICIYNNNLININLWLIMWHHKGELLWWESMKRKRNYIYFKMDVIIFSES